MFSEDLATNHWQSTMTRLI